MLLGYLTQIGDGGGRARGDRGLRRRVRLGDGQSGRHRARTGSRNGGAGRRSCSRRTRTFREEYFPGERRAGRPRPDREDEGQAAAAGRARRDLDHRGIESAAPRVQRAASSTTSTCRPTSSANVLDPGNALKPDYARQGVTLHRVDAAGALLHLLQHGGSGRRRLHAGEDRAAARDHHGLQHRGDDQRLVAGSGAASPRSRSRRGSRATTRASSRAQPYDPATAKALLDKFGYVDRDGDGWRELPDGKPLTIVMASTPTGRDRERDELWKKNMTAIGIRIDFVKQKWPDLLQDGPRRDSCRCGRSAGSPPTARAMRSCSSSTAATSGSRTIRASRCPNTTSSTGSRSGFPTVPSATRSTGRWPSSSRRTTRGTSVSTASRTRWSGRGCWATRST